MRLFPDILKRQLMTKIGSRWQSLQEIRVRIERPIELVFDTNTEWLIENVPVKQDGIFLLNQLSQFSLYRMEEELKQGYITIRGGHRVGLAGKVNTLHGEVKAIKDITSFNIRIAKAKKGIADNYISYLYDERYFNTLIIGAPQTGKTTLLRDIARVIGNGWSNINPAKVGIIDERSEIAGCIEGIAQHEIGIRTDVLDACPKTEGMMMMIRSMSPEVLIVDEIGTKKDVEALQEALHAGVRIICTVHGESLKDIQTRSTFKMLWEEQVFDRFICLERTKKPGVVQCILDSNGTNIVKKQGWRKNEMDRGSSSIRRHHVDRI